MIRKGSYRTAKVALLLVLVLLIAMPQQASAFSSVMTDQSDVYDPDNLTTPPNVWLYSGQTQFVRKTAGTYSMWLPTTSGTLRITQINFCASNGEDLLQNGDYFASHSMANGTVVTTFEVNGTTYYGRKYGSGTNCTLDLEIPISGLTVRENGYYRADITVSFKDNRADSRDGIMNGFRLVSLGGGYVGARPGTTGYTVTQHQSNSNPAYPDHNVFFGTGCSVTANTKVDIIFDDLDNGGGGGAQPVPFNATHPPVTIALRDTTNGLWVNFDEYRNIDTGARSTSVGTVWQPPAVDNQTYALTFTARPEAKYRLEIRNVFHNNTVQFSLPYSQLNYLPCPKSARLNPSASVDKATINAVTGGSATFTNQIYNDLLVGITNQTFRYTVATTGSGAGATWGANAAYSITEPIGLAGNKANFPTATLNINAGSNSLIGQTFCRSIDINSVAAGVAWTIPPPRPEQACVTIVDSPASDFSLSITGADYEKGRGGVVNVTGTITCNTTSGNIEWSITNPDSLPGATKTTACTPGATDTQTVNANSTALLDGKDPGGYVYTASSPATVNTATASVTVYEAPFARFFGSDVRVCGTDANNRFTFDTANGSGNYYRGSFAEYAAIYLSGNNAPNIDLSGLNSSALNSSFPGGLDANYTGLSAGSCDGELNTTSDFAGVSVNTNGLIPATNYSNKVTYKVDGDVTISGNLSITPPGGSFDPNTYPVVFIYASGDININASVTNIEAVLVAGGSINTCADATAPDEIDNLCRNPLKVRGALIADTIRYQRAIGTRLLADPQTTKTVSNTSGTASELVEYPWYLHFVNLELSNTADNTFNAYFALPPRL